MNMILDFVNDVNTENVEIKSLHIHCIQKCNKKEAGCRRILPWQSAPFPVAVSYTHLDVYKRQFRSFVGDLKPRSPIMFAIAI